MEQSGMAIAERLQETFELAAVGIAQINPEGKWLRLNRKYCEILGYSQDELLNKTFQEVTHPEDLALNLRIHKKLLAGELDDFTWEKRYIRKDGSIVWAHVMASLVRNKRGTPLYSIAVVEDISERKKAEEDAERRKALKQVAYEIIDNIRSEIDLDTILWKTAQGIGQFIQADRCIIWLYDNLTQQFQIPNTSREYCRSSGIAPLTTVLADFPGIEKTAVSDELTFPYALGYKKTFNCADVFKIPDLTDMDRKAIQARNIKSLLHVPILYRQQFLGCIRVHSTTSIQHWNEETVSIVEHMAAKIAVAIQHAKTLQDLKESEQALKDYANRLQESNRDLEYFATIASHDLQAPLRKIHLFSQAICEDQDTQLSEESQDSFIRIQKSVEKMQKLIGYLLDLSRVNRKGQPFQKTDLSYVVKDAVKDLNGFIQETGGRVEIGNMITAEVDEDQIQSLFFNLIENGLKFHRKDVSPIVKISAEPIDDNYYQISIQDNGIGIPSEHLENIFRIFHRVHRETYSGTGIGLSLVLRIVERHGGEITVESKVGMGSTFKVKLPFSPPVQNGD